MSTYHLNVQGSEQTKKMLTKIVPLIILAMIPGLIMLYATSKEFPILFVIVPVTLIITTITGLYIGIKRRSSFLFILDADQLIYRGSGRPETRIRREEIKQILESEDGDITIKSIDPTAVIYVPKELMNFDQFKMEISSWKLIEKEQTDKKYLLYAMGVLQVIFAIGAFLFKEIIFFYLIIASIGAFILYQFSLNVKSFFVTKDKGTLARLIVLFLIIAYFLLKYFYSTLK